MLATSQSTWRGPDAQLPTSRSRYVHNVRMTSARYDFYLKLPVAPNEQTDQAPPASLRSASASEANVAPAKPASARGGDATSPEGAESGSVSGSGSDGRVGRMKSAVLSLPSSVRDRVGGRGGGRTPAETVTAAEEVKVSV